MNPTNTKTQVTARLVERPLSRRAALVGGATALAGGAILNDVAAQTTRSGATSRAWPVDRVSPGARSVDAEGKRYSEEHWDVPGMPGEHYTPVVTPNGWTLPFKIVDGIKVFHLVAEEVEHEFAPGLRAKCWGYNGGVHGPTIEAVEGDRIRIYVTNNTPGGTSVHWHGIFLPNGMDGVAGLNQKIIHPGETFKYEYTLRQHGTHMYHSHHDEMTQMALGMIGLFIIHPRNPLGPRPDRDFALMISEWQIVVGTSRPNPNEMTDFNIFTFNARCFPGTAPLVAKLGDRVRIRLVNLGAMDHHPIHLHGYQFPITETDGGPIPESAWQMETSILTAVGQSRTTDFLADEPGDWAMHCHMTHHVMNQMGDQFPNMIGVDPGDLDAQVQQLLPAYMTMGQDGMGEMAEHIEAGHMPVPDNSIPMIGGMGQFDYITMGGLFTILKVHPELPRGYDQDPGWYQNPPGTVASIALPAELQRDDIAPDGAAAPRIPDAVKPASTPAPSPAGKEPMPGQMPGHNMTPGRPMRMQPNGGGGGGGAGPGAAGGHAGHGPSNAAAGAVLTAGAATAPAAKYTCTMHKEVVSDQPGKCPKCGMKLVAKK